MVEQRWQPAGSGDLIDALERFVARVAPFDPEPDVVAASVEVRVGRARGSFVLSARAAAALSELLAGYSDPDDVGACGACGALLGRDLRCARCGYVDGVFGQALAHHAASVLRRESAEPQRGW